MPGANFAPGIAFAALCGKLGLMGLEKKRSLIVPNASQRGVCLWQTLAGGYISDGEGYLSMEGTVGDRRIEEKMRDAAKYWMGNSFGEPKWFPGYRKITDDEYEDQQARLIDGKIPDIVDEAQQLQENRGK